MDSDRQAPASSFWFGLWLIAIACAFLYFAGDIQQLRSSDKNDPGPKSFPVALSLVLLVGGAYQSITGWRSLGRFNVAKADDGSKPVRPPIPWVSTLSARSRTLLLVAASVCLFLTTASAAWRLAGASWQWSCTTAAVLLINVRLWYAPHARGGDVLLLATGLSLLLLTVPLVGFYVPTFLFATLMTLRLGARWWSALLTAAVLLLIIRLLFVGAFRVQLPQGVFGALV